MKKVIFNVLFLLALGISAFAQGGIRQVDFNNFNYKPYCGGEEPRSVSVKNTEFVEEKMSGGLPERFYFKAFAVTYGDLNGDGKEEAFVLTLCNLASEVYFSEGFVYTMKGDKPFLLTRFQGGDRAHGGLRSAKVEKGMFVVERYSVDEANNPCCPEFVVTTNYKWNGREFVEVGMPQRRELYPSTPVSFEKEKNSAVLSVSIPNGKFKRYTVTGRVGQTLTVSTEARNVSVRIVRGAADVNENARGFLAVLNDNTDFVIQIDNISGAQADASIKVELK